MAKLFQGNMKTWNIHFFWCVWREGGAQGYKLIFTTSTLYTLPHVVFILVTPQNMALVPIFSDGYFLYSVVAHQLASIRIHIFSTT